MGVGCERTGLTVAFCDPLPGHAPSMRNMNMCEVISARHALTSLRPVARQAALGPRWQSAIRLHGANRRLKTQVPFTSPFRPWMPRVTRSNRAMGMALWPPRAWLRDGRQPRARPAMCFGPARCRLPHIVHRVRPSLLPVQSRTCYSSSTRGGNSAARATGSVPQPQLQPPSQKTRPCRLRTPHARPPPAPSPPSKPHSLVVSQKGSLACGSAGQPRPLPLPDGHVQVDPRQLLAAAGHVSDGVRVGQRPLLQLLKGGLSKGACFWRGGSCPGQAMRARPACQLHPVTQHRAPAALPAASPTPWPAGVPAAPHC